MVFLPRRPTRCLSLEQAGAYALLIFTHCSIFHGASVEQSYNNAPGASPQRRPQPFLPADYRSLGAPRPSAASYLSAEAAQNFTAEIYTYESSRSIEYVPTSRVLQRHLGRKQSRALGEEKNRQRRASGLEQHVVHGGSSTSGDARRFHVRDKDDGQAGEQERSANGGRVWIKSDTEMQMQDADERELLLAENHAINESTPTSSVRSQVDRGVDDGQMAYRRQADTLTPLVNISVDNIRHLSDGRSPNKPNSASRRPRGPMTALSPLRDALPKWFPASEVPHNSSSTDAQDAFVLGNAHQKNEASKHEDAPAGSVGENGFGAEKRLRGDIYDNNVSEDMCDGVFSECDMPPFSPKKSRDSQRDPQNPEDRTNTLSSADKHNNEGQDGAKSEYREVDEQRTPRSSDEGTVGSNGNPKDLGMSTAGGMLGSTEQYLLDLLAGRETQLKARADELQSQQNTTPPAALLAQIAMVHELREMLGKRFSESPSLLFVDGWGSTEAAAAAVAAGDRPKRSEVDSLIEQRQQAEARNTVSGDTPSRNSTSAEGATPGEIRREEGEKATATTAGSVDRTEDEDSARQRQRRPPSPQEDEEEEERIRDRLKMLNTRRRRYEAAAALWTARKCAGLPLILRNEVTADQLSFQEQTAFTEMLSSSGLEAGGDQAVGRGTEDFRLCHAGDEAFAFLRRASAESAASAKLSESSVYQQPTGDTKNITCSLWRQGCLVCGCFSGQVICSRYCVAASARFDAQDETNRLALACCLVESKETAQLGNLFNTLPQTLLAVPYGYWDDGVKPRRRRPKTTYVTEENQSSTQDSAGSSATPDNTSYAEETATLRASRPSSSTQADAPPLYAGPSVTAREGGRPSTSSSEFTRARESRSAPPSGASPEGTAVDSTGIDVPLPLEDSHSSSSSSSSPPGVAGVPLLREDINVEESLAAESTQPNTPLEATGNEESEKGTKTGEMEEGTAHGPTAGNDLAVESLTKMLKGFNPTARATVEAAIEAASRAIRLVNGAERSTAVFSSVVNEEMSQQQIEESVLSARADPVDPSQAPLQGTYVDETGQTADSQTIESDVSTTSSVVPTAATASPPTSTEALTAVEYQEMLTAGTGGNAAQAALASALMQLLQPLSGGDAASVNSPAANLPERGGSSPQDMLAADGSPEVQSPLGNLLQLLRQQTQQQQLPLSPEQQQQQLPISQLQHNQQGRQGGLQQQGASGAPSQQDSVNATNSRDGPGPGPTADVPPELSGRDVGPYLGPPDRCPAECEVFFDGCTTCQCYNENAAPTCRPRWCRRMATTPTCLQVRPSPGPLDCPPKCFQTFDGCSLCVCDGRGHRLSCRDLCALQNPLQRRSNTGEKRCVRQM